MAEQTTGQAAPTNGGAASSQAAAGSAPAQGTITPEAVQAYLASNPDAWKVLKAPVKVDGREMEVPLADVRDGYQIRSAGQQRLEAVALKEKELAAREAKLAEQGDPIKTLLDRLNPPQAQPEDNPLPGFDPNVDFIGSTQQVAGLAKNLYAELKSEKAKRQALESKLPEVEKMAQNALEAQRQYELRVRIERDFEETRKHNPDFTGRVIVGADGKFTVDPGDNPYITQEAIRLANSDLPDVRLGGKAGSQMTLADISDALTADLERRIEAKKAEAAARKQEAMRNLPGMSVAGATAPEPTTQTTILPTDDAATRKAKALLIRQEVLEQMKANGIKVTPGAI